MALKIAMPSRNYKKIICEEAFQTLRDAGFELVCNDAGRILTREEQKEMISDAYGIITGTESYDADMLSACQECKVICRLGVGTDNYDLKTMKEMGIQVGIISNSNAVAEFALMLILSAMKKLHKHDMGVRRGEWVRYDTNELTGKTVGLVGYGRIAKRLSVLLRVFDTTILAYDPYLTEEQAEVYGVKKVSFEELLIKSDVVSAHVPSTAETFHMFNSETFDKMKDGAYFINTSRGTLVDEAALYQALQSGKLSGAGIDVYEHEPVTADNPLFTLDNIVCTPHCAALTAETNYNAGMICAQSIINVLHGEKPLYPVG